MTKFIPRVSKRSLVFIAGLVWCIAGYNILAIGLPNMINNWSTPVIPIAVSIVVFLLFFKFVFYKMVGKHNRRIKSYQEKRIEIYKFFDLKGYIIMTFMMTFGILLRNSNLIPPLYLGTFYTGLGSALLGAGIGFLILFLKDEY